MSLEIALEAILFLFQEVTSSESLSARWVPSIICSMQEDVRQDAHFSSIEQTTLPAHSLEERWKKKQLYYALIRSQTTAPSQIYCHKTAK